MKAIKAYFANLDEVRTESGKVIFLEVLAAACLGLVVGMLISPRKNVMIGSKNEGNGSYNSAAANTDSET